MGFAGLNPLEIPGCASTQIMRLVGTAVCLGALSSLLEQAYRFWAFCASEPGPKVPVTLVLFGAVRGTVSPLRHGPWSEPRNAGRVWAPWSMAGRIRRSVLPLRPPGDRSRGMRRAGVDQVPRWRGRWLQLPRARRFSGSCDIPVCYRNVHTGARFWSSREAKAHSR